MKTENTNRVFARLTRTGMFSTDHAPTNDELLAVSVAELGDAMDQFIDVFNSPKGRAVERALRRSFLVDRAKAAGASAASVAEEKRKIVDDLNCELAAVRDAPRHMAAIVPTLSRSLETLDGEIARFSKEPYTGLSGEARKLRASLEQGRALIENRFKTAALPENLAKTIADFESVVNNVELLQKKVSEYTFKLRGLRDLMRDVHANAAETAMQQELQSALRALQSEAET